MKYEVSSLEGMDEETQKLYEKSGDKFRVKLEGLEIPDVAGLKAKVDELLKEKKDAAKAAKDAEEKARLAAEEAARKGGDVAALEKSWQEKYDKREADAKAEADNLRAIIDRKTVQATAAELANTLAVEGSAKTLLPHIQSRLRTEFRDGEAVTVVLDTNGKPSAMTVEELGQEFAKDAAFAPIIVASRATGGGANGTTKGGGAAQKTVKRDAFNAMNDVARMEHVKAGGTVID